MGKQSRQLIPMPDILALVPGTTIVERAKRCGVHRSIYYGWLKGVRPNFKHTKRLAKITGLSPGKIRGWSAPRTAPEKRR